MPTKQVQPDLHREYPVKPRTLDSGFIQQEIWTQAVGEGKALLCQRQQKGIFIKSKTAKFRAVGSIYVPQDWRFSNMIPEHAFPKTIPDKLVGKENYEIILHILTDQ